MLFNVLPYGEQALLLNFKNEISLEVHLQVKSVYETLKKMNIKGITDFIPAYQSLTICFCSKTTTYATVKKTIKQTTYPLINRPNENNKITIPVCYELGLDMEFVAKETKLSIPEIINLHSSKTYLVYMMGFTPGFMYLGGLDKKLHISRKKTPRLKVEAGSVGLADMQTGVYPLETPGGWQIIGQTPLKLFSENKKNLVNMGDYIQFKPISKKEFNQIKNNDKNH